MGCPAVGHAMPNARERGSNARLPSHPFAFRSVIEPTSREAPAFESRAGRSANKIGDAGTIALADALARGALPLMRQLHLGHNRVGDRGVAALAAAAGAGGLAQLEVLQLEANAIGDAGVAALAAAAAASSSSSSSGSGAFTKLRSLVLYLNGFGDGCVTGLACALEQGAMPALTELFIGIAFRNHGQLQAVCAARGVDLY